MGSVNVTAESPLLRADARRNRDQIIASATRAFAEHGEDVPMEEIARAAGVGVGTLYRRFPDRTTLVLAVVQDSMRSLLDQVRRCHEDEPTAWDALVRGLSHSRELKLSMRMSHLISPATESRVRADATLQLLRQQLIETFDHLVDAAQVEGSLRPDVATPDVVRLFGSVYHSSHQDPGDTEELHARRALSVVLDGLRVGPHQTLPSRVGSP